MIADFAFYKLQFSRVLVVNMTNSDDVMLRWMLWIENEIHFIENSTRTKAELSPRLALRIDLLDLLLDMWIHALNTLCHHFANWLYAMPSPSHSHPHIFSPLQRCVHRWVQCKSKTQANKLWTSFFASISLHSFSLRLFLIRFLRLCTNLLYSQNEVDPKTWVSSII